MHAKLSQAGLYTYESYLALPGGDRQFLPSLEQRNARSGFAAMPPKFDPTAVVEVYVRATGMLFSSSGVFTAFKVLPS